MEFHEVANIFPMMTGEAYQELKADIEANGLLEPIYTYEGKILDGRNRYAACLDIGVEPIYRKFTGDNPVAFVVSENIKRRHLTSSQRAVCALEILPMLEAEAKKRQEAGINQYSSLPEIIPEAEKGEARDQAAEALGTNSRYVSDAKFIADKSPELLEKVKTGEMKIPEAKRQIKIEEYKEKEIIMPQNKYRVIYADPPWSYGNTMPDYYGVQDNHYPTMTINQICNLPISDITEDSAVLFLWVTSPILYDAENVIKAWGFKYKASFVWDKVKHVMGHYNSVRHEFLLICVKGSCQPDVRKLFDSVVVEERTEHSKKPEVFRNIIDTLYPNGKRIELFARIKAEGWDVYGNDIS